MHNLLYFQYAKLLINVFIKTYVWKEKFYMYTCMFSVTLWDKNNPARPCSLKIMVVFLYLVFEHTEKTDQTMASSSP